MLNGLSARWKRINNVSVSTQQKHIDSQTVILWMNFVAKLLKCLTAPQPAITLALAG